MDATAIAPAGPVPRGRRRLPFQKEAGLFVVGVAALALGLGGPVPALVWLALAVWWWGRPVGLVALFALALALAVWAAPSGRPGAKSPAPAVAAALPAEPRPSQPPPAPASAPESRRPLSEEGIWRLGVPKDHDTTSVRMSAAVAPTAAVAAPGAPVAVPTAPAAATTAAPTAPSAPSSPPSARASSSYKVVEVKDGGTVRGTCRLTGAPAAFAKVDHFKDLNKGCAPEIQDTERVSVGEGGTLGNCVVFVRSIKAGKDFPAEWRAEERTFLIDQKGCTYHPHIGVFRVATQVVVDNSDAADHNIHAYFETPADTTFNSASAPGKRLGDLGAAFLERPGKYLVKCDVHPWMNAYFHVLPHPYVDVTAAKGAAGKGPGEYLLSDVPAGEYELVCWHEGMVETPYSQDGQIKSITYSEDVVQAKKVTVAAGATVATDFEVPYK